MQDNHEGGLVAAEVRETGDVEGVVRTEGVRVDLVRPRRGPLLAANSPMKILSVRAPWWWWIVYGGKDIENRGWKYAPTYHGWVLIHASKWWSKTGFEDDWESARAMERASGKPAVGTWLWSPQKIREAGGHIVGLVYMNDAVWKSDSPWFVGPLGFVLSHANALPRPIPFTARLGLFDAPYEIRRNVASQFRGPSSASETATAITSTAPETAAESGLPASGASRATESDGDVMSPLESK